jgi:uncharacterized protein YggT (Ycf19 family)
MLLRALLPIFVNAEENKLFLFTLVITEPFVIPLRFILFKLNIGQDSPIDWSFFATYLIMSVASMLLPAIEGVKNENIQKKARY